VIMNTTKETKTMQRLSVCVASLLLLLVSVRIESFGKTTVALKTIPVGTGSSAAPQGAKKITIPAGTRILVRMIDSIDSSKQTTGYRFTASLETNLQVDDIVVAPRGTKVIGQLVAAKSSGKMSGSSQLALELTDIMIKGTAYPLLTSTYEIQGKGEGKNTAKKVVGGAGLGALIGGIAGGGKGAGIGAGIGAVGGTAVAASKKGQQLSIPSETLLEFRLQQPAPLPVPA
jgi:hypothetical protein